MSRFRQTLCRGSVKSVGRKRGLRYLRVEIGCHDLDPLSRVTLLHRDRVLYNGFAPTFNGASAIFGLSAVCMCTLYSPLGSFTHPYPNTLCGAIPPGNSSTHHLLQVYSGAGVASLADKKDTPIWFLFTPGIPYVAKFPTAEWYIDYLSPRWLTSWQ